MSKDSTVGPEWEAFAHGREWARGNKPEDPEAFPHVGLAGDDLRRQFLSALATRVDRSRSRRSIPPFSDTELYRDALGIESTETLTRAVHDGSAPTLSYAVGDPAAKSDISGLRAIRELEEIMAGRAPVAYIFGPMGAGKSSKAHLLTQLYDIAHGGDGISLDAIEFGTNIRSSSKADVHLSNFYRVKEWFEENVRTNGEGADVRKEDATPKLFLLDEASSSLRGTGEQGFNVDQLMAPLVYAIRKAKGSLVVVGHDGKDVHPVFRALGVVIEAYRDEQKRMTVYEDIKDRRGVGEIVDVSGVPDTDLPYDDGEQPTFSWDTPDGEDSVEYDAEYIRKLVDESKDAERRRWMHVLEDLRQEGMFGDISQDQLAQQVFDMSGAAVSKWYRRIERDEFDPDDAVEIKGEA